METVNPSNNVETLPDDKVICFFCSFPIPQKEIDQHMSSCNGNSLLESISTSNNTTKPTSIDDLFADLDPFSKLNDGNNNNATTITTTTSTKNTQNDDSKDPISNKIQNNSKFALKEEEEIFVSCPICNKEFASDKIESHVEICLDAPKQEQSKEKEQSKQNNNNNNNNNNNSINSEPVRKLKTSQGILMSSGEYLSAQEEYLEFLKKKSEQEEQDRLLAMKLMNEEKTIEVKKPIELTEDEKIAIEIQKKEEEEYQRLLKEREERDKRIAEELHRKAMLEEQERKQKSEWEDTLQLIKQQAKEEADAQLAKLLREKEELQAQLETLSHTMIDEPVASLTLDDIDYPKYWSKQVSSYQTFDVPKGSEEWNRILYEFHKGMNGVNIKRIERNQNKTLWMFYYLRRQLVASNNNKADPNEKWLFHGSRNDAYDAILSGGFDHRVANLGGAIGAGIYFAVNSATSSGYVSQSKWQHKKMLYCRVTLGSVGPGQHGLRRPPEKSKGKLYDSVGDHHTM